MKIIDEEIASIHTFVNHNTSNSISAIRPWLKGPGKYKGQSGSQALQRDIALLKFASAGKKPSDVSKVNIEILLEEGKGKVGKMFGENEDIESSALMSQPHVSPTT